jgi:hypothetical protein
MITKQGKLFNNRRSNKFEKTAVLDPLSLISGPSVAHVIQNLVNTWRMYRNQDTHKMLLRSFLDGLNQQETISAANSLKDGLFGGTLTPENNILAKHLHAAGKNIGSSAVKNISNIPLSPQHISNIPINPKKGAVYLRKLLKGDFKFLRQLPVEELDHLTTLLPRIIPDLPPNIASELRNLSQYGRLLKQHPEAIKVLEEAYQSSPLFYKTLHGVGKQITAKNLNAYSPISYNKLNTYLNPPAKSHSLRNVGTLAGLGLTTAIEPSTGVMNSFKHAIGYVPSETIAKIPYVGNKLNNTIDYVNKYLVTDPTAKAFNAGLSGVGTYKYTKLREFLKKYLLNPLSSDIEHGSLGVGTALRKLKILQLGKAN